jgi:hypothetical protein
MMDGQRIGMLTNRDHLCLMKRGDEQCSGNQVVFR